MITKVKISGFKSFKDFELELRPFTVVAGLNASGKSNLFDALRLLASIVEKDGRIMDAFQEQRGEVNEQFTAYTDGQVSDEMAFEVELLLPLSVKDAWGQEKKLQSNRLRYELRLRRYVNTYGMQDIEVIYENLEAIKKSEDKWMQFIPAGIRDSLRLSGGRTKPYISTEEERDVTTGILHQDRHGGKGKKMVLKQSPRTLLSSVDSADFPHAFAVREEMRGWRFLQLNPEDLRTPTSKLQGASRMDKTGKNLAAVLYRIKKHDARALRRISRKLNEFVPRFVEVDVRDDEERQQYIIELLDVDGRRHTSRVLSEGTLRILALCILQYDATHKGVLCFEEPENGINPSRIKAMARLLKNLSADMTTGAGELRQVIVNTHSPGFLESVWKDSEDKNREVAMSRTIMRVMDLPGGRTSLQATSIVPVMEEKDQSVPVTPQDSKVTKKMLAEYLQTSN